MILVNILIINHLINIISSAKTLVISFIGLQSQEVDIKPVVKIMLKSDSEQLDEVMVVAYGTAKKSSFTGSANTLKGDMMKNIPVVSVEQKLQGLTTAVNITSSSGQPGANQNIRIRGMGSFNASQEPLFVIDGAPEPKPPELPPET